MNYTIVYFGICLLALFLGVMDVRAGCAILRGKHIRATELFFWLHLPLSFMRVFLSAEQICEREEFANRPFLRRISAISSIVLGGGMIMIGAIGAIAGIVSLL